MESPKLERLRCADCGAHAACDCGAEYIPARAYAQLVLSRNPGKSNRALAADTGIGRKTFDRAKSGGPNGPSENNSQDQPSRPKVVGLDGKSYPAGSEPAPPQRKERPDRQVPFKRQIAVRQFYNALLKLNYQQKCWVWKNILPHYEP